jgi:hypothetical protein
MRLDLILTGGAMVALAIRVRNEARGHRPADYPIFRVNS